MNTRHPGLRLLPFVLLLGLGACSHNNGINVDTGQRETNAAKSSITANTNKSVTATHNSGQQTEMPAAGLIYQALSLITGDLQASTAADPFIQHRMPVTHPHQVAAALILATAEPVQGWPAWTAGGDGNFNDRLAGEFIQREITRVQFADAIMGTLANAMAGAPLTDPAAARAAILKRFRALTFANLHLAWLDAQHIAHRQFARNVTIANGTQPPVHFIVAAAAGAEQADYSADAQGWQLKHFGIPWFGGGAIDGEMRKLTLASGVDAKIDTGVSTAGGVDTGNEAHTAGSAGVK